MIKVVIIEDELAAQQVLTGLINEFIPDINIAGVAGDVKSALKLIELQKPEIVFLDIRLPDGDGFEILEKLKFTNFEVVFTTAYGEFREQAFEHFAFNYLTKPIDLDKLEKTIEKYKEKRSSKVDLEKLVQFKNINSVSSGKIALPARDGHVIVEISDIIRCEGESNYSKVVLKDGAVYTVAKTLKYFENSFNKYAFFRLHKSHLVNTNFIKEVKTDGTVILSNGEKVIVSQRSKKEFMEFIQGGSHLE